MTRTTANANANANAAQAELICAADIKAEPVRWVWHGYLASGKLHILAGSAGTGKTTLAIMMASTIISGGWWPDGSRANRGSVLMWSGEDGVADTLKPRLMANGGNPRDFYFIIGVTKGAEWRQFDPATDMTHLMEAARQIPDLRLIIIDPIVSAVAGDSHKNAEVRRGLQPLVDLAGELKCALLGITHFTKGTQGRDPTERVTGSLAFGALARLVMCTAKPAEEGAKRRVVRSKSNIGPDGGGFEYDLKEVCVDDGPPPIFGQRVVWGEVINGTARELLLAVEEADADANDDGTKKAVLAAATAFLRDLLANGPVPSKTVKSDADDAGHSWATVRRAKLLLGAQSIKVGADGWVWQLSADNTQARRCSTDAEDAQQESMSTFDDDEHLQHDQGQSTGEDDDDWGDL